MKSEPDEALYMADVAFVGLGLSNAMTFLHFLNKLVEEPPLHVMRLLLIERHPVHFTGVAYGPRSGTNSLIITTLEGFVAEEERAEFIAWMKENEEWLFDDFERAGGDLSASWLQSYRRADTATLERDLCVPRMFFGHFLREQVFSMIRLATALGVVDVQAVTGEVRDIDRTPVGYSVDVETHPWSFLAEKIVLGIGPPLGRSLPVRDGVPAHGSRFVVDNPYEHDIGRAAAALAGELTVDARDAPLNVLIVGSNASAIESSYLLFDQPGFRERIDTVFVLSPAGCFPHRRPDRDGQPAFDPIHLRALGRRRGLLAEDIYAALERDIEMWKRRADCAKLPLFASNEELLGAVNALSRSEKLKFASTYGVMIGRFQRRAGDEYLDMADAMTECGKLEHVAGRVAEIVSLDETGIAVEYVPAGAAEPVAFPHKVAAIINCMGPQSLRERRSELVDKLVERGVCRINDSGRGFVVGDDYTAAPGLVVTGPLISGNVIRDRAVWHVEHCGRLTAIAKDVAAMLHDDIVETLFIAA